MKYCSMTVTVGDSRMFTQARLFKHFDQEYIKVPQRTVKLEEAPEGPEQ